MNKVKEKVDDFEKFLLSDLPSKIFPHDEDLEKAIGEHWYRQDAFEKKEDVIEYIERHFDVLRKEIEGNKLSISEKLKKTESKELKGKVVIIKHPSGISFNSYDILCHKDCLHLIDDKQGYFISCRFVKKYQEKNPNMIYMFSEDDGHIQELNWIGDYVVELASKGAKIVFMTKNELLEV